MNNICIVGKIVRDPEQRITGDNLSIVNFTIVWNDPFSKDKENSGSFFDVKIFGKRSEAFFKYHKKGDAALISGVLKQDTWIDRETQQKRSKAVIYANDWTFAPRPSKREDDPAPAPQKAIDYTATGGHVAVDNSDIPFSYLAHDGSLGEC